MQVSVIHTAFEESPKLVASVDVSDELSVNEALNYVWRLTQNIEGSWSRPGNPALGADDVTVMVDLPVNVRTGEEIGLRSTSIGDIIVVGNDTFTVDFDGFNLVAA